MTKYLENEHRIQEDDRERPEQAEDLYRGNHGLHRRHPQRKFNYQ